MPRLTSCRLVLAIRCYAQFGGQLQVTEGSGQTGVPTARTVEVRSTQDVLNLVSHGMGARVERKTDLNEHSSRSHLIITAHLTRRSLLKDGPSEAPHPPATHRATFARPLLSSRSSPRHSRAIFHIVSSSMFWLCVCLVVAQVKPSPAGCTSSTLPVARMPSSPARARTISRCHPAMTRL